MIERNGKSLLNLVNEMLDLSKLEAGKMELRAEAGDVVNFIRYIVESFHSIAESKGVKLHYLASLDRYYTQYDTEKLRQILSNLLSNALKFTPNNGDIYVALSLEEGSQNFLFIKVKDKNISISDLVVKNQIGELITLIPMNSQSGEIGFINTSFIPNGIYYMQINNKGNAVINKKFIILR